MKKISLIILILLVTGFPVLIVSSQSLEEIALVAEEASVFKQALSITNENENKVSLEEENFSEEVSSQPEVSLRRETADIKSTSFSMEEGLAKEISLDLREMDIVDTIKFLSMKGNLNIVTSKDVAGRITLFLKNVTIEDTLDLILLTNKLACQKKKNIITIMTETEYEVLYGEQYTDKREIKTIKIKYITPTKAGEALTNIKSSIGKIITDDATGTLILIDTPEKIAEMEDMANKFDKAIAEKIPSTTTKVFELGNSVAEDIATKISDLLTEGFGSLSSDERTNKIIVNDLPNKIKEIGEMINTFDTQSKEIFIEAKIVEVTLSDDFAFGVDWESVFNVSQKDISFESSFPASGITDSYGRVSLGTWREGFYTGEGTTSEAWSPGGLDPSRAQQILTFLKEVGKAKIISSPYISVCNNEEAKIMVGTRQPYATSTIAQSDAAATTSWSAEFVDVGVSLTVTPTIYKGNFIRMHIKPEISTLIDWFEIQDESGTSQVLLPEVDTSNAETTAMIQDGKTIIIAGMIRETNSEAESRIPFLSRIPFFGRLFKSTSNSAEMKELVIFITPRIISGDKNILSVGKSEKIRKISKYYKEGRKLRKPPRAKIKTEALLQ